jgi:hypothetical protein
MKTMHDNKMAMICMLSASILILRNIVYIHAHYHAHSHAHAHTNLFIIMLRHLPPDLLAWQKKHHGYWLSIRTTFYFGDMSWCVLVSCAS